MNAARAAGAEEKEIREAIGLGEMVRETVAGNTTRFAAGLISETEVQKEKKDKEDKTGSSGSC